MAFRQQQKPYDTDEFKQLSVNEKVIALNARIDKITKGADLKNPNKEFKLPWGIRRGIKGNAKKNKVLCMYLNASGDVKYFFNVVEHGMICVQNKKVGDRYFNAANSFAFKYKNYPLYILKEWSVDPVGGVDYASDVENGRLIHPQTITLRAIEAREAMLKKPMGGMLIWILVAVGVAVVGYIIFSGVTKKGG